MSGDACANCGARLLGSHCHRCGQEAGAGPDTLGAFLADAVGDVLHFRSRTLRSLTTLVVHPGELTDAYLSGRRARYTTPIQVYLIAAAVFFFVGSYRPFLTVTGDGRIASSLSASQVSASFAADLRRLEDHGISPDAFRERFRSTVSRSLPPFMIGSIVLFALALALFSPRRPALRHAVFSLHWIGFFLIVMSIERLLPDVGGALPVDAVDLVFALGVLVHLVLSLRRGYNHGWSRAVASGVALFAVFNAILALWISTVVRYAFHQAV